MSWTSIPAMAIDSSRRFGAADALVGGNERISYAEIEPLVERSTAAVLASGLRRGDRAAIWAPNSIDWITAALGILGAGGSIVPLNTRFKGEEAAYVLRKSDAQLLFTVGDFLDNDYVGMLHSADPSSPVLQSVISLGGEIPGVPTWAELLHSADGLDAARDRINELGEDDVSDVMFTSGTTGRPKGAIVTHGQNLRAYETWCDAVDLRSNDRYMVINPFFHCFGYKAGWMAALMRGAAVVPQPVFDVERVLRCVEEERITVLPGPPTLLLGVLDHPERDKHDLSTLRLTITGAATVPVQLIERLRSELSFESVLTGYALTESSGLATMSRSDDRAEDVALWAGRALPGIEVRVVDETGAPVPPGEQGEIVIRGYVVMKGYLDEPEETAAAIDRDGSLHTGDIGVMDERGFVRVTDRKKDMYIVGGFNAYPAEIEKILMGMDGVGQVAVVGAPDPRMGEVGAAFVVPRPGAELTSDEVIRWAREHMANFKVPRYVEIVEQLPLNASMKVVKPVLRERAKQLTSTSI